jgi:hypothetical protein
MGGRAYITIVRWPKGFTAQQRLEALADSMGIDPYMAGLRAVHETPFVGGLVDELVAPDIVERFKKYGVIAFALTQTHIQRLPHPKLVKRLVPALGCAEPMYMAEFWRDEASGLKSQDIFLLVRGTVDRSSVRTSVTNKGLTRQSGGLGAIAGIGFGLAIPGVPEVSHHTETKLSQILDIYLADRSLLRINSDRINFDVLGKDRGFTATENVDKLATRLAAEAPSAIIDTGFARFKPPADVEVESFRAASNGSSTRQRDEGSAFDFYSGWIYTINRGLTRH